MGHVSASAAAPPRVRLPQGTYEGVVLAAGQNVIESAGLGLGIGSSGGGSSSSTSSSSSGPQPIPQQMALPKTLEAFLGIPYAQSTAGANRFRAPVPLAIDPRGAGGPIPATQLGQRCPGAAFNPFVPEGEDCLNLNVYRPASPSSSALASPLPVVIYVHSGGFNNGMGVERDMASFVAYAPVAVVAVSFNYRVGALGFLGLAGTGAVAPLNVGLRDQQALFAWVHRSIAAFGGDPDNVTLMGLSAGAHSIGHHLLYYTPGEAPFHKAILESGGPTARAVWNADHPRPTAQLREFLVGAGVLSTEAASRSALPPHDDILARLRALPLAALLAASRAVWGAYQANVCWPFQPVIDGDVITERPLEKLRRRTTTNTDGGLGFPILTGFDSNEGTIFVPGDRARADTDAHFRAFFAELVPGLAPGDLDELARLYPDPTAGPNPESSPYHLHAPFPPGVTGRQWARLEAAYAHYAYICPVLQLADLAGRNANGTVYLYEFAARAQTWDAANHGDNQAAVAHSMAVLHGHPGLQRVADAMNGAWARFAAVGRPGDCLGAGWAPFTPSGPALMVFGEGNDERVPPPQRRSGPAAKAGAVAAARTLSALELAQCRFWWARVGLSQGTGLPEDGEGGHRSRL